MRIKELCECEELKTVGIMTLIGLVFYILHLNPRICLILEILLYTHLYDYEISKDNNKIYIIMISAVYITTLISMVNMIINLIWLIY